MAKSLAQQFLDTLDLRAGGVITQREVAALQRRWNARNTPERTIAETEAVNQRAPFQVCAESTAQGLAWWKARVFTPKGEFRDTTFTRECADMKPHFRDAITEFSHFTLVEFALESNGYRTLSTPLCAMVAHSGYRFEFLMRPWQRGGNIISG